MTANKPSTCHLCNQRLVGTYLTYSTGLVVCSRCDTTVPHCSRCGIPSHQLTAVRGKQVCSACHQHLLVCGYCGIPILKEYTKFGDSPTPYCQSCVTTAPRCAICHVPSRKLLAVRGEQVCSACSPKLRVCACCGIPILKEYTIIEGSSASYCQTCMETRPHCDICQAPLSNQGRTLRERGGNNYRCASCYRTAVTTMEEAQQLYQQTSSLLKRELKLDIPMLPELHVVERAQLAVFHQQNSKRKPARTSLEKEPQHLQGYFQRVGGKQDISIEQVLPRTLFQAVAAHELAHAWQSINAPSGQPPRIVEGFAEWVSYRILLALGQQAEAERLNRRTDLYGEGLHYFLALERERGYNGVLQRAMQK